MSNSENYWKWIVRNTKIKYKIMLFAFKTKKSIKNTIKYVWKKLRNQYYVYELEKFCFKLNKQK